jgi:hypothetical protein
MKSKFTMAAAIAATLGLGLAGAAFAHPMEGGGPGFFGGGAGHRHAQGMGAGPMSQLFTEQERTALRQQMQDAKTPEERQALKQAHRTEMQKRAAEKGVTLPDHAGHGRGMRGGMHNK